MTGARIAKPHRPRSIAREKGSADAGASATSGRCLNGAPIGSPAHDEAARLDAVRRYEILDSPPEDSFDRLTAVAARIFTAPVAGVSIVDQDRIWFKSRQGVPLAEVARAPGLCGSTIMGAEVYVLTDAARDERARDHPLVAGEFGVRFYAGAPLCTPDGHNLGALFVIDTAPRSIRRRQRDHLQDLAAVVMDQLELRLSARRFATATTVAPRSLAWKAGASSAPNRLRLTDWRRARGLTGVELARLSGLSASYISFLEHGRRRYNKDTLHALSKALRCSGAQLLGGPPSAASGRAPTAHPIGEQRVIAVPDTGGD